MEKLEIKNILVTGGSGKIGRSLLPELLKAGYHVRAIKHEGDVTCKGVEIMEGDLGDPGLARKALRDMDAIINLANVKENKQLFMETNIHGTFYLLDESKACGHIKQFIQAGSDARAGIYFYPHPYPIDETYPHRAYPGYYAFSKVLEEVMCEQYFIQYKLPITILRFSWVFDEDDILAHLSLKEAPNFGVPVWREIAKSPEQKKYFEKGMDGIAELVHPGGKPGIRHVVGIKDVVQAILLSAGNPAAIGEAFTVAGPSPFSYGEVAKYASEKLNLPIVRFEQEGFYDFTHSIAKTRSFLGYNPQWDIFRIVDDAIAFRRAGKKRTFLKYPG